MGHYEASDIEACFQGKKIRLIGDSTIRQAFQDISVRLGSEYDPFIPHEDQTKVYDRFNASVEFYWDPFLNRTDSHLLETLQSSANEGASEGFLMLGTGLHYAAWINDSVNKFASQMDIFLPSIKNVNAVKKAFSIYVMPVLPSFYSNLDERRAAVITKEKVDAMNNYLFRKLDGSQHSRQTGPVVLWAFNKMMKAGQEAYDPMMIHANPLVAAQKSDVLLNHYCNPILAKQGKSVPNASCCVPSGSTSYLRQKMVLYILAFILGLAILWNWRANTSHNNEQHHAVIIFVTTCLLCFGVDRAHALDKLPKLHDATFFFYATMALLILVGFGTIRMISSESDNRLDNINTSLINTTGQKALSRNQTEEWKGWMQIVILLYDYTGTSSTLWIYQVIHLLIAAYLFMTGYGNTISILESRSLSPGRRITRQLLRLNLLSLVLAYTMGISYSSYYFAPLVSFWTLVVYLCMSILQSWNHHIHRILIKVIVCTILTTFLVTKQGVLEFLLNGIAKICSMDISAEEWRDRLSLDLFVVYVGILCAAVLHNLRQKHLHIESVPLKTKLLSEGIFTMALVTTSIGGLFAWSYAAYYTITKQQYNAIHPSISPLPVLAFAYLRNCLKSLRSRYSLGLARLGKFTLETSTLRCHLLLANDAKATFGIPLFPHVNRTSGWIQAIELLLLALPFLYLSEKTSEAIHSIVAFFTSEETPFSHAYAYKTFQPVNSVESKDELVMERELDQSESYFGSRMLNNLTQFVLYCWQSLTARLIAFLFVLTLINWFGQ
jgi:hypothetical protein